MKYQEVLVSKILLVVAMLLIAGLPAAASSLCTTGTLDTYTTVSGANYDCSIGNLMFLFPASGAYTLNGSTGSTAQTSVTVTPVGTGAAGSPTGFIFTYTGSGAGWTAANGVNPLVDINLSFTASLEAAAPYAITSSTLAISDNISNPNGLKNKISAGETVTGAGQINLNIFDSTDALSIGWGGTALSGSIALDGTSYAVSKDILVKASNSGTTTVNSITETFTYGAVPEPGSFLLAGAGLGLVLLVRRRAALSRLLGLLAVVMVLACGSAHASPIQCSLVGGSTPYISDFISAGQCTINDVLFTFNAGSFNISGNADIAYSASQTAAYVMNSGGQIGFHFVPVIDVAAPPSESETLIISFTAQAQSAMVTGFASSYTGTTYAGGNYSVGTAETQVSSSDIPTSVGTDPLNLLLTGSGSATYSAPVSTGSIITFTDTFILNAPNGETGDDAHLSNTVMTITEQASQVPEPLTMSLVGGSLLVLGLAVRRKRASKA